MKENTMATNFEPKGTYVSFSKIKPSTVIEIVKITPPPIHDSLIHI